MWKYFTEKETEKWIDVLPDLLYSYNHSFHNSIGMKPADALKLKMRRWSGTIFMEHFLLMILRFLNLKLETQ